MHAFVLASLPHNTPNFDFTPPSRCEATPGEPLHGLTRVTERHAVGSDPRKAIYAVGSVTRRVSERILVVDLDTDPERWTTALLNSRKKAASHDRQIGAAAREIRHMLTVAGHCPVGTEAEFHVMPSVGAARVTDIEMRLTEASVVTRIIAADLAVTAAALIGTLLARR